jgi:hypothetical protein
MKFSDISEEQKINISDNDLQQMKINIPQDTFINFIKEKEGLFYDEEKNKKSKEYNEILDILKLDKIEISEKLHFIDQDLYKYTNNNIDIIGTPQPDKSPFKLLQFMKTIVEINNRFVYITFEPDDESQEEIIFNNICKEKFNEKYAFHKIIITDYTPPTEEQLIEFWKILDKYEMVEDTRHSIIMHCTGGTGRTATMLMSYIWLIKYRNEPNEENKQKMINFEGLDEVESYVPRTYKFKCERFHSLYINIKKNSFIKELITEIKTYTPIAKEEIFDKTDNNLLLLKRIFIISKTIVKYEKERLNTTHYKYIKYKNKYENLKRIINIK